MAKMPTHRMKGRMIVVLVGMIALGFCVVLHQLFKLQIVDAQMLQGYAMRQQLKTYRISPQRGTIYDTNMRALAQSANVYSVCIAPQQLVGDNDKITKRNRDAVADLLNEYLDIDKDKLYKTMEKTGRLYEVVKTKVEKPMVDTLTKEIEDKGIAGIFFEQDTRRYYPFGNFAATVLGFTNKENVGAYGLESYYEKTLAGTPGRTVALRNSRDVNMPLQYEQSYDAQDGNSLVLTLDEKIQHFLEKNIETAVSEHRVEKRVTGIVMDVKTGAILAMASKPDFDPNEPYEIWSDRAKKELAELKKEADELNTEEAKNAYQQAVTNAQFAQWRNSAISDPYEPGSVFKIITASGALESGSATLNSTYYCPGYIEVAGHVIHCWVWGSRNEGHGMQDFTHAVMNSCNPAFIRIGLDEGVQTFRDYFENFGLTKGTGIDLPGEAGSIFYGKDMTESNLASSSFGQTFKVTPIQLITACCAAVNGGKLMRPYIVKQVIDPEGDVVSTTEPFVQRQVVSEEISKKMCLVLEQVVAEGSGKQAKIPGYRVGGKTGTSEKIEKLPDGTENHKNILSFFGFAPIDDPQVACLVLLDEPDLYNQYGSTIAAPIVGAILADVLPYLGIEPNYDESELEPTLTMTPYLINSDIHDAQSTLRIAGLKFRVVGNGSKVVRQVPGAQEPVPQDGTIILYTEDMSEQQVETPNVVGMTAEEANRVLTLAGLHISITGESIENAYVIASSQSPEAGTMVLPESIVTVEFVRREQPSDQGSG